MPATDHTALNAAASDIPKGSWVDRFLPPPMRPYARLMRLDRPIGTWLLLFPCWWSTALASTGRWPDPWLVVLFAIGALVMRGAGCVVNDIADRDFDAKVARTADRPIPSGAVSVFQAIAFLGGLLAIGLAVLLQLNANTVWLGIASIPLVVAYPFMKRITYWPQAFLGLTFNFGALVGWSAVTGSLGWPAVALYLGGIAWTLGYDTIYAHQDKEDDILVGVKSSALKLGADTRRWLFLFYGTALALYVAAGALAGLAWPFYLLALGAGGHLAWQAARVDLDRPDQCLATFKSNRHFGWMLLAAIVLGQIA